MADEAAHCGHCGRELEQSGNEKETIFGLGDVSSEEIQEEIEARREAADREDGGEPGSESASGSSELADDDGGESATSEASPGGSDSRLDVGAETAEEESIDDLDAPDLEQQSPSSLGLKDDEGEIEDESVAESEPPFDPEKGDDVESIGGLDEGRFDPPPDDEGAATGSAPDLGGDPSHPEGGLSGTEVDEAVESGETRAGEGASDAEEPAAGEVSDSEMDPAKRPTRSMDPAETPSPEDVGPVAPDDGAADEPGALAGEDREVDGEMAMADTERDLEGAPTTDEIAPTEDGIVDPAARASDEGAAGAGEGEVGRAPTMGPDQSEPAESVSSSAGSPEKKETPATASHAPAQKTGEESGIGLKVLMGVVAVMGLLLGISLVLLVLFFLGSVG